MVKPRRLAEIAVYLMREKGMDPDDVAELMRAFLARVDREADLVHVQHTLERMVHAHKSNDGAHIKTPHPLDKDVLEHITHVLGATEYSTEKAADMLGGCEAEYRGKEIGINFNRELTRLEDHLVS